MRPRQEFTEKQISEVRQALKSVTDKEDFQRVPQLNPVEHLWKEIREKYFANVVFESIDAVEHRLMEALVFMNQNHDTVKSFSGFEWIVTSL